MTLSDRIEREKHTVGIMIEMYCSKHHNNVDSPCQDCNELIEFAIERINKCIFHKDKPVCSECQVHCYRKELREKIRTVMRFVGPRMIYQHPILGIRHLIDKRKYVYIDPKAYKSLKNTKPLN